MQGAVHSLFHSAFLRGSDEPSGRSEPVHGSEPVRTGHDLPHILCICLQKESSNAIWLVWCSSVYHGLDCDLYKSRGWKLA